MTPARRARLASVLRRRWGEGRPAAEVVDELFRAVLLRPADEESLDYYVRALGRGLPLDAVVTSVATSVEATENAWRAPVAAALGPALMAQADQRQVYAALPPGYSTGAHAAVDRRFPAVGQRLVLGGFELDQLYWTPRLVRDRAGLITGPMGRAGRALVSPDALGVLVVTRPATPAAEAQARCLLGRPGSGRAWIDYDPVAEAHADGLDGTGPLQVLNQAGPAGVDPAALSEAALAALREFDIVLVLPGPPAGGDEGDGADWVLYRAALESER